MKEKDEEKMVRLGLAALFCLPLILAREADEKNHDKTIDTALELADELIRKAK